MDRTLPARPGHAPRAAWWTRFASGLARFADAAEMTPADVLAQRLTRLEARLAALETRQRGA